MATSGDLTVSVSKALGVPFETVREHLRVIRRTPNTISFSGYGRSAAHMIPRDAVRLLLAVAGTLMVKDAKASLDGFRKLQPLKVARRQSEQKDGARSLEDHLVEEMERLIALRGQLPAAYVRSVKDLRHGSIALTLISAAVAGSQTAPRAAIARRYTNTGTAAVSFGTPGWSKPVLSETDYALQLPDSGLLYSHHVTTWALAEIAHSL